MNMGMFVLVVCLVAGHGLIVAGAGHEIIRVNQVGAELSCYTCNNVELSIDNKIIRELIGGHWSSDPSCEANPSRTTDCEPGEICGYVESSATYSSLLVGTSSAKFVWRGCVPEDEVLSNTCMGLSKKVKEIAEIGDAAVDAKVCSCNSDLCDAGCPGFAVRIDKYCISWWIVIGCGGGLLVLISICCCCCCYCCCRSRSPRTYVTLTEAPSASVVMTTNTHLPQTASPVGGGVQNFPPSYGESVKSNLV